MSELSTARQVADFYGVKPNTVLERKAIRCTRCLKEDDL
jgi:ribosomal protein S27AE